MDKNAVRFPKEQREIRYGKEVQNIANRFRRLGDENLQKEGITISQLRVIAFISKNGNAGTVYQKDLEEHLCVRRSSVTSLLQNMEKSGILIRGGSEKDARIKTLVLTEKGKRLDEKLIYYIKTLEEKLMEGFSSEEKEILQGFLFRMIENLEKVERNLI